MVKQNNLSAADKTEICTVLPAAVPIWANGRCRIGCFTWFTRYMKNVGRRFIKKVECKYLWQLEFPGCR